MENLKELALEILENACETDEIREDLDLDLFEAGLMDSMASVAVLLELEEKCSISLQPTDIDKEDISTVNNFTSFVSGYQDFNVGVVTSFNVTGLGIGTYFYRVRAVNGCGNTTSSSSLDQTVTTVNPSATISGTTSVCQNAARRRRSGANSGCGCPQNLSF